MALTQLTPVENWVKIINDNFSKTDLANLNWHKVSPGCTWLNGSTSYFNDLFYTQIGNAKLCLLEVGFVKVPRLAQDTPCLRVAKEYAPSITCRKWIAAAERLYCGAQRWWQY